MLRAVDYMLIGANQESFVVGHKKLVRGRKTSSPPLFKTTMQFSFVNVAIFAALAVAFANAAPLRDRQSYDVSPVIGQILVEEGDVQADA